MIPTYLLVATFVAGLHASYGTLCIPRRCSSFCEFGRAQDFDGCNTCACRTTDPCEENNCGARERCEINYEPCNYAPCRPTKCVQIVEELVCPELCSRECPYGNEVDENGCKICECKPNPCEGHLCEEDTVCEAKRRPCDYEPCPTYHDAVCVPKPKCEQAMKAGPCEAAMSRYFFNQDTQRCTPFVYGGCLGNDNNFETAESCKEECGHECPGVCRMGCPWGFELDEFGCEICECKPHPCDAVQCEAYSKCVPVKTECTTTPCPVQYTGVCKSINDCQLPKLVGNCRASIPRYFFNTATHECEQFNYGGCDGNGNNFETMEACAEFCVPKSVVACEGERAELQCSGETSIEIVYANYGRTSTSECPDASGSYSNANCNNEDRSKDIVAQMCDGASTCSVVASNSVFGDPCHRTLKYLEVRYRCIERPGIQTTTTCEQEQATLRCPNGTSIDIMYANFGRTSTAPCHHSRWGHSNVDCNNQGRSKDIMVQRCNDVNTCNVPASTSVFGDPCGGTWKYLEVRHQCIETPDLKTMTACEQEQAILRCPSGTTIAIWYANYGRTSTALCHHSRWGYSDINCLSQDRSKEIMVERCDGVNTCSVPVSNSVFGDPCGGTWKYLEVRYHCIETPGATDSTTPGYNLP